MKFFISAKLILLILFFAHVSAKAQIINDQDIFKELPERFVYQVKQMDEFLNRFNGNENFEGVRINAESTSLEDRERNLASLFNLELMKDEAFRKKATRFVKQVAESKFRYLSFYDKTNYATVACQVMYKNNQELLTLSLVMDGNAQSGSRWAINGAQAEFLINKSARLQEGMIPPTNHEVDFIELIKVFNGEKEIRDYVSFNHKPNQLDILTYAIENGEIKMLSTSTPTFHFNQVPNWSFSVSLFNRNSNNSGWLISELEELNVVLKEEATEEKKTSEIITKTGEASVVTSPEVEGSDEIIYEIVDVMPSFEGGLHEFYKQLGKNLKYPSVARSRNVQGKVYISYIVDVDGTIADVKVLKGIGYGCDEEALRALENAPKWKPGEKDGDPVRVRMVLPITFSLK